MQMKSGRSPERNSICGYEVWVDLAPKTENAENDRCPEMPYITFTISPDFNGDTKSTKTCVLCWTTQHLELTKGMAKFTFLPPTSHEKTVREKELEHAQIKAHAARVSHQKRGWLKVQQQLKQQEQQACDSAQTASQSEDRPPARSRELVLLLQDFHGSSDPFDACPVKITPEINRIIRYARDVMLPNVFSPPIFRRLTMGGPRYVSYEQSENVIGGSSNLINIKLFKDMTEGAALGWLCGHIPQILRLDLKSEEAVQTLSMARLNMRAKSLKLLRQHVMDDPNRSTETLIALRLHIRTIYEAECMAGDTEAARAHLKILLQLDDPDTDEHIRLQHLLVIMFNATEMACRKLERTVLPFGDWVSERFKSLWAISFPFTPIPPESVNEAHSSVSMEPLRKAMLRLRYSLWVAETPLPFRSAAERLKADMIFAWIVTKTFNDLGILINLYMDIIEEKISFDSEGRRMVQACMVLTLLYMLRKCLHSAKIDDGTDVREMSHVLIPRLQQDLTAAMEVMTPAEQSYYQDTVLWMLYAGTLHERRQTRKLKECASDSEQPARRWFVSTLARHARSMKVTAWEQARDVLQKFVYDVYLEPDGHAWFEGIMQVEDGADGSKTVGLERDDQSDGDLSASA